MEDLMKANPVYVANAGNDVFGGNSWWIIILLLFMFGGNGFFGRGTNDAGFQGVVTRADVNDSFAFNRIDQNVAGLQKGLSDSTYALKSTMDAGFCGVERAIDACCCNTARNIDSVKAEICNQTNTIVNAIHSEGEATRALITQNTIQDLRDKLNVANSTLAQNAQSRYILGELGRYVTNPPCTPCVNTCPGNGQF